MLASVSRSRRGASAYVPQYVRIRDEITRRIEGGELAQGQRIPSLREMCDEFGVSSITARRALLDLLNEGIVERRGGLGAFVTGMRRRARIAVVIIGYSEGAWRQNSGSFGQLVGGIASSMWEHEALLTVLPVNDPMTAATALRQLLHDQPVDGLLFRVAGDVDWRVVDIPAEQEIDAVLIEAHAPCRPGYPPCSPTRARPAPWPSSTSSPSAIAASGCSRRRRRLTRTAITRPASSRPSTAMASASGASWCRP